MLLSYWPLVLSFKKRAFKTRQETGKIANIHSQYKSVENCSCVPNNMKINILLLLTLFLFFSPIHAQRTAMTGTVIDVLSGDLMIVNGSHDAKFTVKLLYVDAPEQSQELFQTAKQHLSAFVLNKEIRFDVKVWSANVVQSKVLLDGIDIGMQMLRDGAAFYDFPGGVSQDPNDREFYTSNETLAKNEKRGIWALKSVIPVYQLRAERENREKERMDKEFDAYMKSAVAMARFKTPTIGMHYFAFKTLCEAGSEADDSVSTYEATSGTSFLVSLVTTKKRIDNQCVGNFSFDEKFRLDYISMHGHLKP